MLSWHCRQFGLAGMKRWCADAPNSPQQWLVEPGKVASMYHVGVGFSKVSSVGFGFCSVGVEFCVVCVRLAVSMWICGSCSCSETTSLVGSPIPPDLPELGTRPAVGGLDLYWATSTGVSPWPENAFAFSYDYIYIYIYISLN